MFSKFLVQFVQTSPRFIHSVAVAAHSLNPIKLDVLPPKQVEIPATIQNLPVGVKYRMEIAKPSDTNRILNFLEKNYFCEDSLSKSLNLCSMKLETSLELHVKSILLQGISLIARENSRENQIIGVCVNQKNCKWHGDHLEELANITKNQNTKILLRIWALISREPAMHDYLYQHNIFDLTFISVRKENHELTSELVESSLNLARDINFSFARIDCTNNETMKIAEKFEMEKLWEAAYKNIISDDDKMPVAVLEPPNTHVAAYYINLKTMPVGAVGRKFMESD